MDPQVKKNIIYPAYINSNRTYAKGRRIPLKSAVSEPKANEIADALCALKLSQVCVEVKPYCRETQKEAVPQRIRYLNLKNSKNNFTNKRQILVACAKRINEVRSKSCSGSSQLENAQHSGKQKKKHQK